MRTTPDNEKLLDLISEARKGRLVLPQFQRNFVWSREDITALLVSIFEGHFIGSFLLLRTDRDEQPFAIRAIQGVELDNQHLNAERMILDGQQRLTSLHYAFAAPNISLKWTKYPYRFFIDLNIACQGDLEKAIFSERSDRSDDLLSQDAQFNRLVIPLTEIERWDDWQNTYEHWLAEKDQSQYLDYYFPEVRPKWRKLLKTVQDFLVPTMEIPKISPDRPEKLAELCAIFEKMNSTGVRLSVYDLLTARLYRFGIDLHNLWEQAINENDLLNQFSDGEPDAYGVYLLRTISLIRGYDAKSKSIINLNHHGFTNDWHRAVEYFEKALVRLTSTNEDGFGIIDPKWMPYSTMISPLAAMLSIIDSERIGHIGYKLIQKWYWASVFRERYAGAVESTIYRDFQDFKTAINDPKFEPDALQDAKHNIIDNPSFSLRSFSRVNSVYRGVMCLSAKKGAKDFQADDSIEFHTLNDHHIFPKHYLKQIKNDKGEELYPNSMINSIVNRTLISDITNQRIKSRSPEQYLDKIVPQSRCEEIMMSHFINSDALEAMKSNNYEKFITERERVIMSEISRHLT